MRANSHLNSSQYSAPVLGLIFLRYADYKFSVETKQIKKKKSARRSVGKIDYQAQGVLYLPEKSLIWNGRKWTLLINKFRS